MSPTATPPPELEQDSPGDPESVARAICLRLLTARPRTRVELADALRRRGVPDDAASAVLTRLAEVGLVDDASLAEAFARTQHRERGLAGRAVAAKLRRRGLDEVAVQSALSVIDRDSEASTARMLVERKLPSLGSLDQPAKARRLFGLLARRGYPAGLATAIVREVLSTDAVPDGCDESA